jgi:hypothetical protein
LAGGDRAAAAAAGVVVGVVEEEEEEEAGVEAGAFDSSVASVRNVVWCDRGPASLGVCVSETPQ